MPKSMQQVKEKYKTSQRIAQREYGTVGRNGKENETKVEVKSNANETNIQNLLLEIDSAYRVHTI